MKRLVWKSHGKTIRTIRGGSDEKSIRIVGQQECWVCLSENFENSHLGRDSNCWELQGFGSCIARKVGEEVGTIIGANVKQYPFQIYVNVVVSQHVTSLKTDGLIDAKRRP